GAGLRARARLLLYRCARLEEDSCAPARPARNAGSYQGRARAHSRADRPFHRRGVAGRDCGGGSWGGHSGAQVACAGGGMKCGPVAPAEALGAIAVHSIRKGDLVLKKGTRIGEAEAAALRTAGIEEIVVARIEPGDVSEDEAAADIAAAVAGEGARVDRAFTGRANLFAETAGVLLVDRAAIDRLNRVDPAITLATLPAFAPVVAGKMIATVKIIPFAVEAQSRDRA